MPVKITVQGQTRAEIQRSITALADAFGVALPGVGVTLEAADLSVLIDFLVERLLAEGLDCKVVQLAYDSKSPGGRLAKKAGRGRKPTSVLTPPAEDVSDWEKLKAEAIRRIRDAYFQPGGRDIVDGILAEFGGGAAKFTEVDADQFRFIVKAMKERGIWGDE